MTELQKALEYLISSTDGLHNRFGIPQIVPTDTKALDSRIRIHLEGPC